MDRAFSETSIHQIAPGSIFSTSPRVEGPPEIALQTSFHTASTHSGRWLESKAVVRTGTLLTRRAIALVACR